VLRRRARGGRRRVAVRVVAVLAAVALAGVGLARWTGVLGGKGSGRAATLVPAECSAQIKAESAVRTLGRHVTYTCYRLAVPVDYAQPDGPQIQMYVMRARLDGQSDRVGSLVLNPGGPGASGVDYAEYYARTLPTELLRRFDLVGFDPRGVAGSDPVSCLTDAQRDIGGSVDAPTSAEYAARAARSERTAASCRRKYGDRLEAYNSTDTARDMDRLREALGEPKLSYLGYSYGTVLGSAYATLFPDRVRAMVLDSSVDLRADQVTRTEQQIAGAEELFDIFAADCVHRHCPLGADPRAFLARLIAKAAAHPIPARKDKRTADAATVLDAALAGLYYRRSYWPTVAQALADADHGNADSVLTLVDQWTGRQSNGTHTNEVDAGVVVHCTDFADRPTDAVVKKALVDWRRRYPLFGPIHALQLLDCRGWPAPRHPVPTISAPTAPTILVSAARYDPVTPYIGAQHLVRALGHATLLTWNGHGHGAYPVDGCLNDAVDAYLISGTVPPPATTCPEST
jgi:pimeloyl-ACP methyl ester carboxylesterase